MKSYFVREDAGRRKCAASDISSLTQNATRKWRTLRIDEIEALSSIYGDDWCVIDEAARIFCITITNSSDDSKWNLNLQVIHALIVFWLFILSCRENIGENILYLWVEKIREFVVEKSQASDTADPGPVLKTTTEENDVEEESEILISSDLSNELFQNLSLAAHIDSSQEDVPTILHGEPISDRRSTFQAHLAPVVSPLQVKAVLNKLYENKKIAAATHNIYAYRIHSKKTNTFIQDCEDDGETAAGKRLLHLMQILDARDVMVVVSRWYGGVLLGPDRFKHINNCARNILVDQNYTTTTVSGARSSVTIGKKYFATSAPQCIQTKLSLFP
uniref:Impact N-terminal domain-containing protein n=1 Tax=Leptobrachium leishanense TaxID=445787 RepID=A0A8C5MSF9_9ANUR